MFGDLDLRGPVKDNPYHLAGVRHGTLFHATPALSEICAPDFMGKCGLARELSDIAPRHNFGWRASQEKECRAFLTAARILLRSYAENPHLGGLNTEKGKPVARRGRKATGLTEPAGLPKVRLPLIHASLSNWMTGIIGCYAGQPAACP